MAPNHQRETGTVLTACWDRWAHGISHAACSERKLSAAHKNDQINTAAN